MLKPLKEITVVIILGLKVTLGWITLGWLDGVLLLPIDTVYPCWEECLVRFRKIKIYLSFIMVINNAKQEMLRSG